ncbi:hypothetical protein ACFLZZ_03455 [Nanoarchaeota archaeon]
MKRGLIIGVLIVLSFLMIGGCGKETKQPVRITIEGPVVDDFESCAIVGEIMESYPRQCSYEEAVYVEELSEEVTE